MITLKKLSKSYNGKQVLDKIDLSINDGERVLISGDSGIGKTTLFRCIAGLETYEGSITDLTGKISYVVQNHPFMPWLNIKDNIQLPLRLSGQDFNNTLYKHFLSEFGLEGHDNKYPEQVSGGQLQRFAIIQALMTDYKVLLLDEAFKGLEKSLYEKILSFLSDYCNHNNITLLYITHDDVSKSHFTKELILGDKKYIYKPLLR